MSKILIYCPFCKNNLYQNVNYIETCALFECLNCRLPNYHSKYSVGVGINNKIIFINAYIDNFYLYVNYNKNYNKIFTFELYNDLDPQIYYKPVNISFEIDFSDISKLKHKLKTIVNFQ